jgi:outer membrane scaffolding protein for murein synthesis (MipA/OmpV family)
LAAAESDPAPSFNLTYGVGLAGLSGVYVGQDDELIPFPVFVLSHGKWSLSIDKGIQFYALETATTTLSFAIVYEPTPEAPKTALFAGLNRDDGAALEIDVSHNFGAFDVAGTIKRDASQIHDGIAAEVSVGRTIAVGNAFVEGRLGGSYLDQNYGNYLYGVAASEANALRATYDVKANWSPYIEISATLPINDLTTIAAGFRHEQLSQEISDSPLVGSDERTTMGLSIIRTF